MSKTLTLEKLKSLIGEAITHIHSTFAVLLDRNTSRDNKRVSLLSYWIKDYSQYILKEDDFDPKQLIRYDRGCIIQAEFGYRIGSELGGRHYAIVLDNHNSVYSDIITVVPLTSLKPSYKPNRYTYIPQKDISELVSDKIDERIDKLQQRIVVFRSREDALTQDYANGRIAIDEYKKVYGKLKKEQKELVVQIAMLKKQIKHFEKLKSGTVINFGQIITISKMRITNPKLKTDSLYKIKLASDDLNVLNNKIEDLFIHKS